MTERLHDLDAPETAFCEMLNTLAPMHVLLDARGCVLHVGPTVRKMLAPADTFGAPFWTLFEFRRAQVIQDVPSLLRKVGRRLHGAFRAVPEVEMKGMVMHCPPGVGRAHLIVNLSFGISLVDAVRAFDLTSGDFAVTDLAVEMLYLHEANTMAMEASRQLNIRLDGARTLAEEQACTDTLTGLLNRRALDALVSDLIEHGDDFVLMHLDLDFFKEVNDTLGHAAGDFVLCEVARILQETTREGDKIARAGGDEFVLVFSPALSPVDLQSVANRLISALKAPLIYAGTPCRVSASMGSAVSTDYACPQLGTMMQDADLALYAAKARGRACHVAYGADLRTLPPVSQPGGTLARADDRGPRDQPSRQPQQ